MTENKLEYRYIKIDQLFRDIDYSIKYIINNINTYTRKDMLLATARYVHDIMDEYTIEILYTDSFYKDISLYRETFNKLNNVAYNTDMTDNYYVKSCLNYLNNIINMGIKMEEERFNARIQGKT